MLLIDEIDKADIDFPNDLLRELDEKKFTIEELVGVDLTEDEIKAGWQPTYEAQNRPVIIITSNDEKELPDAFLRRCFFYYIDFPKKGKLLEIVTANVIDQDKRSPDPKMVEHRHADSTFQRDKRPAQSARHRRAD